MGTHGGGTDSLESALATCATDVADTGAASQEGGLRWVPMVIGDVPGLTQLADIVEPPLKIIIGVLRFVKGVLDVVKTLLSAFTDPFKALILAAYELLKGIIDDILDTGVHIYADAPGITSLKGSARELGRAITPPTKWKAGQKTEEEVPPGNFDAWASRFQDSFDDAGDRQRPILSDGASIEALFVIASVPDLPELRVFMDLFGNLMSLQDFKNAFEKYPGVRGSDFLSDADRFRVRGEAVAPNWVGGDLVTLFPVLEHLQHLPEVLKGLLLTVDNLIGLLKNLVDAVANKVDVMLQLAEAIQAVIDFIRSLSASGLYSLAVSTDDGVSGLTEAFLTAEDRPPGEHMAGVCLLGSGAAVLPVWAALGQDGKFEEAWSSLEGEWEDLKEQGEQALEDALAAGAAAGEEVDDLADALADDVEAGGEAFEEAVEQLEDDVNSAVTAVEEVLGGGSISPAGLAAVQLTRRARRRGRRSLAMLPATTGGNG